MLSSVQNCLFNITNGNFFFAKTWNFVNLDLKITEILVIKNVSNVSFFNLIIQNSKIWRGFTYSQINNLIISDYSLERNVLNQYFIKCLDFYGDKTAISLTNLKLSENTNILSFNATKFISFVNISSSILLKQIQFLNNNFSNTNLLYIENNSKEIQIINCSIINNEAFDAISSYFFFFKINNVIFNLCSFKNNNLKNENRTGSTMLKLMNFNKSEFFSCDFLDNYAFFTTTGIELNNIDYYQVFAPTNIFNCNFVNNLANYTYSSIDSLNGAAISFSSPGNTTISFSKFSNNTIIFNNLIRLASSPCIFAINNYLDQNLIIDSCIFQNNEAFSISSCLYFEGNHFSLTNSFFSGNVIMKKEINISKTTVDFSLNSGSNIFLNALSTNIENCTISNAFGGTGSAIYLLLQFSSKVNKNIDLMYSKTMTFSFTNIQINEGESYSDGASINIYVMDYRQKPIFLFQNCSFKNNIARECGGVFNFGGYLITSTSIIFKECNFEGNIAKKGGVLFCNFYQAIMEFDKCIFTGNQAFSNNQGGGVIYSTIFQQILVYNCTFLHNFAQFKASIIFMNQGFFQDTGSLFYNNTANYEAGMIILINGAVFSMSYSTVLVAYSKDKGGFAGVLRNSQLILTNCLFDNISSSSNSFLFALEEANIEIYGCNLSNFFSSNKLGEIISVRGVENSLNISNCILSNWSGSSKSYFNLIFNKFFFNNNTILNLNGCFIESQYAQINISQLNVANYICSSETLAHCFGFFKNSVISIIDLFIKNITLNYKQSLFSSSLSYFKLESANISELNNIFQVNQRYKSFFLSLKESTFEISSCYISQINITAFQIILSSGIFYNVTVFNTFKNDSNQIKGQFISCYICIKLEVSFCLIMGMQSAIGPVIQINDIYDSFFYQTIIGYDIYPFEPNFSTLLIHNSNFSLNKALNRGGAFYILDLSLIIQNSTFSFNQANQEGGAIFFNCTDTGFNNKICNWNIQDCQFINNSAVDRGGVVHWLNRAPIMADSNIYEGNTAAQGPKFSSNPIKLQRSDLMENDSFISGYHVPNTSLKFNLLDSYDQNYNDSGSLAYLIFDDNKTTANFLQKFVGNQFVSIKDGCFNFEDFNIVSEPGKDANLLVFTDSISYVSKYLDVNNNSLHRNINNNYYFELKIHMRDCIQGEILLNSSNLCFSCPDGFFSFNPSDSQCQQCPLNAICLRNKPFLTKPGYWRMHGNSSKLYRCTILKGGCGGGTFENQCKIGYTGPLCSACVFNDTDQYFNSFGGCVKCGSSKTFLILITVAILLIGMVGLIFFSIKDSQAFAMRQDLNEVLVTVLINILINYSQLFSIISNIDIKWPEFLSSSSSSSSSSSTPTSITDFMGMIECPIASFAYSNHYSIFYVQMVMMAFFFFAILTGNLIFWLIFKLLRLKIWKKETDLKNNIILTYIAIYVLMLQPLLNFFTKGFSCIEVGDDISKKQFLKVAPSIECWEEIHISLVKNVIVPFLLIFIIPPPIMMLYYIKKHYKSQNKEAIQRNFMVTVGYNDKYCYWEFVILLKKIILMYLSIFIRNEPVICVLTLLIVLLIFCNLHIVYSPYKYAFLNKLIFQQYAALFVCYSIFLYFSYTESVSASVFLLLILLFANVIFFTHWLILFIRYFKISIANALKITADLVSNIRHLTSSFRRGEHNRKRNAILKNKNTISSPKTSRFCRKGNNGDFKYNKKRIIKTTPGRNHHIFSEEYELNEIGFKSEKKIIIKKEEVEGEKFKEMLIMNQENLEKRME